MPSRRLQRKLRLFVAFVRLRRWRSIPRPSLKPEVPVGVIWRRPLVEIEIPVEFEDHLHERADLPNDSTRVRSRVDPVKVAGGGAKEPARRRDFAPLQQAPHVFQMCRRALEFEFSRLICLDEGPAVLPQRLCHVTGELVRQRLQP